MKNVTFQNGQKTVTLSIVGSEDWSKGDCSRTYFTLDCTEKRSVVSRLYRVESGTFKLDFGDEKVEVDGATYVYRYGPSADSKSKMRIIDEEIVNLIKQI